MQLLRIKIIKICILFIVIQCLYFAVCAQNKFRYSAETGYLATGINQWRDHYFPKDQFSSRLSHGAYVGLNIERNRFNSYVDLEYLELRQERKGVFDNGLYLTHYSVLFKNNYLRPGIDFGYSLFGKKLNVFVGFQLVSGTLVSEGSKNAVKYDSDGRVYRTNEYVDISSAWRAGVQGNFSFGENWSLRVKMRSEYYWNNAPFHFLLSSCNMDNSMFTYHTIRHSWFYTFQMGLAYKIPTKK